MEIKEIQDGFSESEVKDLTKIKSRDQEKYPALKTLSGLFAFIGYLFILLGIAMLYFFYRIDGLVNGIAALLVGVLLSIFMFAFSNLIYLFMDIEKNTRREK